MFNVGDKVRWKSQAAGSQTEKVGKVVFILKYGDIPVAIHHEKFPSHKRMFDGYSIPGGYDTGYLIEVRDGKTDKAAPKLYLPYPGKLVAA